MWECLNALQDHSFGTYAEFSDTQQGKKCMNDPYNSRL